MEQQQIDEFQSIQLDTLKSLFTSVDPQIIEEQFTNTCYDFLQTKKIIRVLCDSDEDENDNDEEEKEEIVDIDKYNISDYSEQDSEDEGDFEDEHEELNDINDNNESQIQVPECNKGENGSPNFRNKTNEDYQKANRRYNQHARKNVKNFKRPGVRTDFRDQCDGLYKMLNDYNVVLRPEIRYCKYKLNRALKYKKFKAITYWKNRLKELQDTYMLYQKQAIEIKTEANLTDLDKNKLDLHSMTLSEALFAVKSYIIK